MLRRFGGLRMFGIHEQKLLKIPGRKSLNDICKLPLLEASPPEQVINVWLNHHQQVIQYYGRVISVAAYDAMRPRLSKSPFFIVPVFRDKGLFNAVTNFNDDLVGVLPLGEYQKKGDHANIHMTVQFFTELAVSKKLVLIRCELHDKHFSRQDCLFVTHMLIKYYTLPHLYEQYVESFNHRPNAFDYHAYLRQIKDEAGKDNIAIQDKKHEAAPRDAGGLFGGGVALPSKAVSDAILRTAHKGPSTTGTDSASTN